MKNVILLFSFLGCLLCAESVQAQEFKSAVGARLGYPLSISYKKFLNETNAFEIYAGTRGFNGGFNYNFRSYSVSGAYLKHTPIESVEGLSYYYGGGANVNFWTFGGFEGDNAATSFGIQAYGGLSYTFENKPINITLDWIPSYFINGFANGFGADYGSLAVRYILSGE